jgi:hypothetical protein
MLPPVNAPRRNVVSRHLFCRKVRGDIYFTTTMTLPAGRTSAGRGPGLALQSLARSKFRQPAMSLVLFQSAWLTQGEFSAILPQKARELLRSRPVRVTPVFTAV